MNRNNIWIHFSIAVVLITIAAVLGQIDRWGSSLNPSGTTIKRITFGRPLDKKTGAEHTPEVLVRFKPGTSLDVIKRLAVRNNDRLVDEIESVDGLTVIDDLDDADAVSVAEQYAAMSDLVTYAEPNFRIELD